MPRRLSVNPVEKAPEYPSSRGHSGGSAGSARIDNPNRRTGMLPLPKTDGGPSMSPDVNASEIMQSMVMNDDDKEWYALLFKELQKDFLKSKNAASSVEPTDRGMNSVNSGLDLSLKGCLISEELVTEPDNAEKKRKKRKKKKTDEFNAVSTGNVAGYTLPLGASNQNRKARKKNASINARAFANGKVVGKL